MLSSHLDDPTAGSLDPSPTIWNRTRADVAEKKARPQETETAEEERHPRLARGVSLGRRSRASDKSVRAAGVPNTFRIDDEHVARR